MTTFSDAQFRDCFKPLLDQHNECKPRIAEMRRKFRARAENFAKFMREKMCGTYASGGYTHVAPGYPAAGQLPTPCEHSQARLKDVIAGTSVGCGPNAFDAWDGRWSGKYSWNKTRPSETNHHIWDEARRIGDQWVQPVTQTTSGEFVDGENIARKKERNETDLAINVYDEECGLTGWVSKFQNGERKDFLFIAYCIGGRLIWINQELDPETKEPVNEDEYMVFYEWVVEPRYGMIGRRFKINGNDFDDLQGGNANEQHVGVYERPLIDRILKALSDLWEAVKDLGKALWDFIRDLFD